ncbi:MAG: ATP-binding cassette domain-containing protein [Candidatus Poseidoniaceae archaeon]
MGIIQLSDVTVRRGRSTVLENWSLTVDSGEVVCLFGENGCGKSTVIETVAGLVPMENGTATISGQLIRDSAGRRGRTRFGLCLQSDCVMGDELVGERLFDVAGSKFDVESLLKQWGLDHRIHDRVAMLSGGQRRKLAVLSALVPAMITDENTAILLDEPDSGLDSKSVDLLCETLRNLAAGGHSILISSHNSKIQQCSDKTVSFPFEITENNCRKGVFEKIETTSHHKGYIGHRINLRTLSGLANNGISGLLVLGAMLALLDPANLDSRMQIAFILAPALASGLTGNPIHKLTLENRTFAWWKTRSSIPPNALLHSVVLCGLLTMLESTITGGFNAELIVIGAFLGMITEAIVGWISYSTLSLARPNAVMIRLLTPILILPWAIIVDTLSS